ncbi:MAG: hypothetical protein JRG71_04645 [Deltaproteobacteria bacterium]|nr:hypothetical protein [Deltaproteobacteria bacterium]
MPTPINDVAARTHFTNTVAENMTAYIHLRFIDRILHYDELVEENRQFKTELAERRAKDLPSNDQC